MIKLYRSVLCMTLLTFAMLGRASGQESLPTKPLELWASCTQCHATPDQRVVGDQGWIALNRETSCLTGAAAAPEVRESLIAYLRSQTPSRPRLVCADHSTKAKEGHGLLKVPKVAGSAYLVPLQRKDDTKPSPKLRVKWNASEAGSAIRIPEGRFRLVNYGFHRTDSNQDRWRISCTPGDSAEVIKVSADAPATLAVTPSFHSHLTALSTKEGFALKFSPSDQAGHRMTLTKNMRLVTPQWTIHDASGNAVDRGKFVVL